jgi:exonuclease VII small subunit
MQGAAVQQAGDPGAASAPGVDGTPAGSAVHGANGAGNGANGTRARPTVEDGRGRKVTELRLELDRLSLEQSLADFEVANARVMDLTQRLADAAQEIRSLRTELDDLRRAQGSLEAELSRTRSTKAYRFAEKVWELRRALNV